MPFFGYVVSGIQYSDSTTQLETSLLAGGFVNSASKPKKWHLIWDNVSNQNSSDFNAKLLVDYLDLTDENYQSVWFQWNKDYPKSAIEFWPVIAELSREQLYLDVADIMHKALSLKAGRSQQTFQSYMWDQACDALNTKPFQRLMQVCCRKPFDFTRFASDSGKSTSPIGACKGL